MVCETATITLETLLMASKLMFELKEPTVLLGVGGLLEVWKTNAGPNGKENAVAPWRTCGVLGDLIRR